MPVSPRVREAIVLAADGGVITAGVWAALTGAAFGLEAVTGQSMAEPGTATSAAAFLGWLLTVIGLFIGPVVAWVLHGRKLNAAAWIGLVLGLPIGSAVVLPVAALGAVLDFVVGLFTDVEFAGAIAFAVIAVAVFAFTIVRVDIGAFKDLSGAREYLLRDVARLASTVAIAAFGGVVAAMMLAGKDAFEAFAFVLLAAVEGAAVVSVAGLVTTFLSSRKTGRLPEPTS